MKAYCSDSSTGTVHLDAFQPGQDGDEKSVSNDSSVGLNEFKGSPKTLTGSEEDEKDFDVEKGRL